MLGTHKGAFPFEISPTKTYINGRIQNINAFIYENGYKNKIRVFPDETSKQTQSAKWN